MARSTIPTALDMRRLKYGEASDQEVLACAKALRDADRHAEALLLFERRPALLPLKDEVRWAVSKGSVFHLMSIRRMGLEVSADDLRSAAARALDAGRALDARHAFLALEDHEALLAIADQLPDSLKPEAPPADDAG